MNQPKPLIAATHAVTLPEGAAPEWVELIPAGTFTGRDGRGPYTTEVDSVLAQFAALGMPVAIDYEHQTMMVEENGQPAPAAAWIRALEARDGAIWGRVEWTPRAAAMVADREYRFLSPEFLHTPAGVVMALSGAGLTNRPNLYLTALNRAGSPPMTKGVHRMDDDMLERLRYMLNLPTLATQAEIAAELDKLVAQLKAPETAAMRQSLGLTEETGLAGLITAAQTRVAVPPVDLARYVERAEYDTVAHKLATLEAERAAEAVEAAVTAAMREGKLLPAQADWARAYCRQDAEGFATWATLAPVVAPLGEVATHGRATEAPDADDAQALSDRATAYMRAEAEQGRAINIAQAVAHVARS